jgi:hypothetical protein
MVIAERVGHESIDSIQTVYSTSCRTTRIAPDRPTTTRGLRKRAPDSGVDVPPQLPKNAFMTMAGGLTTMEVERDNRLPSTGRRSLCTSEWYTRSATPQGGTP